MRKFLNEAGLICIAAFLAPNESVRDRVADTVGRERFFIVHLTADEAIRKSRDSKGHYVAAEEGRLPNFPGVTALFEEPTAPDLVLDTGKLTVEQSTEQVIELLRERQIIR